jgi:hypothetical protein
VTLTWAWAAVDVRPIESRHIDERPVASRDGEARRLGNTPVEPVGADLVEANVVAFGRVEARYLAARHEGMVVNARRGVRRKSAMGLRPGA